MRLVVLAAIVLTVAACGDSNTGPGGTKPPPTFSFDTLATGSIPSSGGTLTVHKSGDPLDGLTLTISPNAFSSTVSFTIGSSTNKNLPTSNGLAPISPVIHILSSTGGYANGAITIKIPATVSANTVPVTVFYDSASRAMEPLTSITYDASSVTSAAGHLNNANILNASLVASSSTRGGIRARLMAAAASDTGGGATLAVYAISTTLLNQDWDTGFRPGANDWDMPNFRTEATAPRGPGTGIVATELWYFNTKASTTPLNGRFAIVRNASLSDKIGYHWTSVVSKQVDFQFNALTQAFYDDLAMNPQDKDSLQFNSIRASFALAGLNGGTPLPVIVDLRGTGGFVFVVAYKAIGDKIFVADPGSPGDAGRFLQLGSGGTMVPYTNNTAYGAGVSLFNPVTMSLGVAVPLATLASTYPQAVSGSIGNDLFPASGFYSWSGALSDTMYVVDTLRIWAQCASCQYGFATTLSPAPAANVETSFNIYFLSNGLATDSIGGLSSNGLLVTSANPLPGSQKVLGLPVFSADSAGGLSSSTAERWLDWHQFTIANLKGTVTLPTGGALVGDPDTLQVSFKPDLLPADVAYQWSFGDSTPTTTVQNSATAIHSFAKGGTLPITVKVIDNRNSQVIARADTTLGSSNAELWRIQSISWLYTTINGARSDTVPPDTVLTIIPGTVPTLINLSGPPFPNATYNEAGFGFVSPPDSAQQWAQYEPIALAISGPHPPIDVFSYTNTGTATSGTITGSAIQSHTGVVTNGGFTVNLTKKGSTLSGYIMQQATVTDHKGVTTSGVVVDTVVAIRVP